MTECAQYGDDFRKTFVCSVCGDVHCLSHRKRSEHDCVSTTKPTIRPLGTDGWSRISHAVTVLLFLVLSLTFVLYLVQLLT